MSAAELAAAADLAAAAERAAAELAAELAANAARAPVRPDSPTFAELGARPETVEALAAVGITHAFAIQEYALPIGLRGTDMIGQAPTGTGKTLGFGVPLLDRVVAPAEGADGLPQALVVVPTRELGLQVARDIQAAGRTRGVRVLPVYGGVAYEPQVEALRKGVEIIVGTPGRLLDLSRPQKGKQQAYLKLDRVRALVLDEADRMLDLGFLDDVEKILAMLPEDRQTMLFSATMPDPIVTLARRFLRQPVTIHARHDAATAASPLTKQVVYRTHPMNKTEVVARILQAEGRGLTMIFTRTKRAADRVSEDLDFRGFAVAAVHGDLGQGARERALRAFRNGKIDVLVATDVAARGLDVSGVTHVINFDCPEDPDTYTHRIGRTGRAGATGVAVTFVDWEDMPRWRIIDKTLGLEMPEPPETYHTSAHLYTDLAISTDATGTLPTAQRNRAGLGAEVEEDLGGRSRESTSRGGRRPARRGDSRPETPSEPRVRTRRRRMGSDAPDGAVAETVRSDGPGEGRRRSRRRVGVDAAVDAPTPPAAAPVASTGPFADDAVLEAPAGESRSRRRRRSGRDTPVAAPLGPEAPLAADAAPVPVDEAGDTRPVTRRRRTVVTASEPEPVVDASPNIDSDAPAPRRRRSTTKAAAVPDIAPDTAAPDPAGPDAAPGTDAPGTAAPGTDDAAASAEAPAPEAPTRRRRPVATRAADAAPAADTTTPRRRATRERAEDAAESRPTEVAGDDAPVTQRRTTTGMTYTDGAPAPLFSSANLGVDGPFEGEPQPQQRPRRRRVPSKGD